MAVGLSLAMVLASCDSPPATERRFQAFGTEVHLVVGGPDSARAAAAAREIESDFARIGVDWYAFGTGELAHVNARLAKGQAAPVSEELGALLQRAQLLGRMSGGLFEPGVCALVRLWQFDTEKDLAVANGPPPVAAIQTLRTHDGSIADLHFAHGTVSSTRPVCMDLGGIAKGTALMRAGAILARHHITSALIDIGGSSQLAIGTHGADTRTPAARPWMIGLRDPRADRLLARLHLKPGEAASTSGDYERAYVLDGHRYHHILDPRTGMPTTGTASVTVLAADAELADAASTALMVAGPAGFSELCAALAIRDALLITTDGKLLATPSMARRLRADNDGQLPLPPWP